MLQQAFQAEISASSRLVAAATICGALLLLGLQTSAADKIYVYRQAGGVVKFSTKPPSPGVRAEVWSRKGKAYSVMGRHYVQSSKLFHDRYHEIIVSEAGKHSLDIALIKAVIHAESAFDPRAVSPKGALGLMQIMPQTARIYAVRQPFDPQENIRGGSTHLAKLIRKYKDNTALALAAYNAGEEAVRQHGGIPPYRETQEYVKRVINLRSRYSAALKG